MKTLFLPLNSANLTHYIKRGVIIPANLLNNRHNDIQSTYINSILLSKHKWLNNNDCSLEIVIDDIKITEKNNEIIAETAIPISRIKNIWFADKKQAETTLWNIINSTAYIPDELIKIDKNIKYKTVEIKGFNSLSSIDAKIVAFDKILGGLAFINVGKNEQSSYAHNFFTILSDINSLIDSNLPKNTDIFNYNYKGLITLSKENWKILLSHLDKEITKDYVIKLAKQFNISIKNNYVINFNEINLGNVNGRIIYYLSILATYGEGKSKKIEDLIFDLKNNKISYNKELVAFLYGRYVGYSNLLFKFNNEAIKFKLDSKLDYYTIESVYQFVFNNKINNTYFKYLDDWVPKFVCKIKNIDDFETYKVLDKIIIIKKLIKPDSVEFLDIFFNKYFSNLENVPLINLKELKKAFSDFQKQIVIQYSKILDKEKNKKLIQNNKIEASNEQNKKNINYSKLKKDEIITLLKEKGIKYNRTDKKEILLKRLKQQDTIQPPTLFQKNE